MFQQLEKERTEKANMQEELGEAQESISHLELEVNQQFESFEKEKAERAQVEGQLKREM